MRDAGGKLWMTEMKVYENARDEAAKMTRKKLGNVLVGSCKQVVVVSNIYIGLPLAADSITLESEVHADIKLILSDAIARSAATIRKELITAGHTITRRRVEQAITALVKSGDLTEPAFLADRNESGQTTKLFLSTLFNLKEKLRCLAGLQCEWMTRQTVEEMWQLSERTARRRIAELIHADLLKSNGRKGSAVRYRMTECAQIDGNESFKVHPSTRSGSQVYTLQRFVDELYDLSLDLLEV